MLAFQPEYKSTVTFRSGNITETGIPHALPFEFLSHPALIIRTSQATRYIALTDARWARKSDRTPAL